MRSLCHHSFPFHSLLFRSESLKDHAIALAFKRTLDDSRTKKGYIGQGDIKNLLATTLVFSKSLLVFDLNDGSRDHSISLADFKRSLVHMDIRLPDIAANQVERDLEYFHFHFSNKSLCISKNFSGILD